MLLFFMIIWDSTVIFSSPTLDAFHGPTIVMAIWIVLKHSKWDMSGATTDDKYYKPMVWCLIGSWYLNRYRSVQRHPLASSLLWSALLTACFDRSASSLCFTESRFPHKCLSKPLLFALVFPGRISMRGKTFIHLLHPAKKVKRQIF